MENSLKITGAPSLEELHKSPAYPDKDRLYKGPVAIIECIEEIPCNPCEAACPNKAITIGESITNLPVMDLEKCVACGFSFNSFTSLQNNNVIIQDRR